MSVGGKRTDWTLEFAMMPKHVIAGDAQAVAILPQHVGHRALLPLPPMDHLRW